MARVILIWAVLIAVIAAPIALAATSPLIAWRSLVYVAAGFAGIIGLCLLLIQPLLISGTLPGLSGRLSRRIHRWTGLGLVVMVVVHVGGLWLTSPPDVIDALLFVSPTPFSDWGVVAMWGLFATALLAMFRRRLRFSPRNWRMAHGLLAVVIVICTIVHAILIEGTMETLSKAALCALVFAAMLKVTFDLKLWTDLRHNIASWFK